MKDDQVLLAVVVVAAAVASVVEADVVDADAGVVDVDVVDDVRVRYLGGRPRSRQSTRKTRAWQTND